MDLDITKEEFEAFFNEPDKLFVVDFHAVWCGPCKVIGPVIEELAEDYKDRAIIRKINVDNQNEVAQQYGIRSIPTILFFKNGELVEKNVGQTSKLQLEEMIETHL
ncbi:MAG: putative host-like protein [uncultured marine phage]|uniref:Putative host-like protein n=1 Tax=uncultured marine phage TaxID=707152 RepID=A0A8D9FR76_9VIRU|nr:MAG: putative host-like protein [uncultured marine phage]